MAHGHWLKDYIGPHSGGSGGSDGSDTLVVKFDHVEGELPNPNEVYDKTWNEVFSALENNIRVVVRFEDLEDPQNGIGIFPVIGARLYEGVYSIAYIIRSSEENVGARDLYASSADGYLQSNQPGSEGGGGTTT